MPELPDVELYVDALRTRVAGVRLEKLRFASPFVLRTFDPPVETVIGRVVRNVRRLGKRIVFELEDDFFVVVHLMIAGRFKWAAPGAKLSGKTALATFDFSSGTLILTEASAKKRASIHLVAGRDAIDEIDRGGVEPLEISLETFRERLTAERHTLKRTLTDPRLFSGIGNAYSDEILHRARLSPLQLTTNLDASEIERLFAAVQSTLREWIERLRNETADRFPEKVTAFRPEMAVHGKFGQPCPDCRSPVQRIVYAENEANYCPACQTGGKLLADRSLSRLLRDDWPRSVEEMEERLQRYRDPAV